MNIIEKLNKNVIPSYGRCEVVLEKGKNGKVTDETGKIYIDFGSGIGTNSLGFCDGDWVKAVSDQAGKLQHMSNYYYTKPNADLAEKLCEVSGYSKCFFANSGAEANECAIKIARKYSFDKYGRGRHNIITLTNSFHGRTITTISATGQDVFHNYFFPFTEGFVYVETNNINDLREKFDDTVCAVMFEYIQGEGGVNELDNEFIDEIFKLCAEKDAITIADEVQSGVGRTGKFLAGEWYERQADVTTIAKGIGGGLPIGVCLADAKRADVLQPGTHASTFGGNPISCAAAIVVLNKITANNFLEEVNRKSEIFRNFLLKLPIVKEISGRGLMLGVSLENKNKDKNKSKNAKSILNECLKNGLLILTAGEKIRLLPPLTISDEEINEGLNILEKLLN